MTTNFKSFSISPDLDVEGLKKQFKKLALTYHPDITKRDTNRKMQEIITEYEKALKYVGELKNKDYSLDHDYVSIINELVKMKRFSLERDKMKFYKVLVIRCDGKLVSPFRQYEYEPGKEYICEDFDPK